MDNCNRNSLWLTKNDIIDKNSILIREGDGEVAEWLKAPLSKSGILPKAGSWVRIPPSPPNIAGKSIHPSR